MSPTDASDPPEARRLLVGLHGYDDDPAALSARLHALDLPPRFAVVTPRGATVTESGGPAWFPSAPADDGPPLAATLDGLRRSGAAWQEDGEVVVLGYSQGAAVALALALGATNAWRPRAVVGLASWLPNEPGVEWGVATAARAGLRVLLVHGGDDEVVPVEQGRSVERLLKRSDAEVTWLEIDGGHELEPLLDAARPWLLGSPAG